MFTWHLNTMCVERIVYLFSVTQECTPNEMIFTISTNEGFTGRIYTYKHFDRSPCFIRGNGGQSHRFVVVFFLNYPLNAKNG